VIAIELLVAAQGIDFSCIHPKTHRKMKAGKGVQASYEAIRKHITHLTHDRILHDDIEASLQLLKEGVVLKAVERAAGELQ
jgi:histidine ammonia-lyase